jgi:uncharacterized protein YecE (DUF72 family)
VKAIDPPPPDPARYAEAEALANRAEEPARFRNVRFGTAGWTDRTLVKSGLFYPKGTSSAEARLTHYARHFELVEVDATYYTLLPPETAENWLGWTPETFVFDVKAHPILTGHPIDVTRMPKDLKAALVAGGHERRVYPDKLPRELAEEIELRFRSMVEPLRGAGRLGCVMLQFPPWFTSTRGNARRIEEVAEKWAGVRLSAEFRHRSWLEPDRRERVQRLLAANDIAYVVVDEPDVSTGGVPPLPLVTSKKLALVRFHGKNVAGWAKKGASVHERFDWLYSEEELRAWTEPVKRLANEAENVHAIFNNCVRNYAVVNAKGLSVLLENATHPED